MAFENATLENIPLAQKWADPNERLINAPGLRHAVEGNGDCWADPRLIYVRHNRRPLNCVRAPLGGHVTAAQRVSIGLSANSFTCIAKGRRHARPRRVVAFLVVLLGVFSHSLGIRISATALPRP